MRGRSAWVLSSCLFFASALAQAQTPPNSVGPAQAAAAPVTRADLPGAIPVRFVVDGAGRYSVNLRVVSLPMACEVPCSLELPSGRHEVNIEGERQFRSEFLVPERPVTVRIAPRNVAMIASGGTMIAVGTVGLVTSLVVGPVLGLVGLFTLFADTGAGVALLSTGAAVLVTGVVGGPILMAVGGGLVGGGHIPRLHVTPTEQMAQWIPRPSGLDGDLRTAGFASLPRLQFSF